MNLFLSPITRRSGFTLLEMVISIGVVLVMVVLAFPIYRAISTTKDGVKCMNNMRIIYMAMLAFTEDYDGRLPPPRGPATEIHPDFYYNAFWCSQSYLGNYAIVRPNPKRDSTGRFTQQEAEVFNCPARFVDGPDSQWSPDGTPPKPAISYLMPGPDTHLFRAMENKSTRPFILEGRHHTVWAGVCKTGAMGIYDAGKRLRRYHRGGMNILYYDGHVKRFDGLDSELAAKL